MLVKHMDGDPGALVPYSILFLVINIASNLTKLTGEVEKVAFCMLQTLADDFPLFPNTPSP